MSKVFRWVMVIPALVALFLVATAVSGNSSTLIAAALLTSTTQPTKQATPAATRVRPTATPSPEVASTAEATADQSSLVLSVAPSPDAGTLGVVLDQTQDNVTLASVVSGGPADKAGLQGGDVVTAVDGTDVTDAPSFVAAVTAKKPGDTVTLTITRAGKSDDFTVTLASRREIYCPLPAPTAAAGTGLITGDPKWTVEALGSPGATINQSGGKMSFKPFDKGHPWQAFASTKPDNAKSLTDFVLSVDITQTNQTVGGLMLNYEAANHSTYLVEFQSNGTWFIRAFSADGTSSSGPSFSEPTWKTPAKSPADATSTNTVGVTMQSDNFYLSLNGNFVCGFPLSSVVDPPLPGGTVGAFVVVDGDPSGKLGVTFSNVKLNAIKS